MKLLKKLALLAFTAVFCLALGLAAGCKKEESSSTGELSEYVYKIRVQSEGGFGLKNVVVGLYDGDTLVKEKTTSAQGNAYFTDEDGIELGEYDVRISDVPAGWHANESISYKTSKTEKSDLSISMTPRLITDESIPSGKLYQLGDVMYDFTVQTCSGQSVQLSKVLEEKRMVLLNFWATWCGPCKSEFPAMQNAYVEEKEVVSVLAVSTTDTQAAVSDYQEENGLTFDMAGETDLPSRFGVSAVPVSIVIDRYGVISYWHVGSMTAKSDFIGLFDKFTGEDYIQTVIGEDEYEGSDSENTDETEQVKPNVSAPSATDAAALLNDNGDFTVSWDDGEYSWPFIIEKDANGEDALFAANKGVHNSYSIMNVTFEADENDVLFFDAAFSTELDADFLHVVMDGTLIHSLSGNPEVKWATYCAYVFADGEDGEHTLSFTFTKDGSMSGGEDEVWIKNMRLVSNANAAAVNKTVKDEVGSVDIFRNAATVLNEVKEGATEKKPLYKNYVSYVYNETDGYYHVGTKDGPYLMANTMNTSNWNTYDAWQLAYSGLLIVDGMNVGLALEDYAWAATQRVGNEYVPVTKALRHLLDTIVRAENVEGAKADPEYHLDYHANEWLELCVYYDHYGEEQKLTDPMAGITFDGAIEIKEGKNTIKCDIALVPLGIKHKFIPAETGVYHLYSTVAAEYEDTASAYDPQCWVFADDRKTQLAYSDDMMLDTADTNFDNFEIYLKMEAGKTYYCLFAFFLNDVGTFEMRIDKVDADKDGNIDTTFKYLTNVAINPFSYNEVTGETYVPDAKEWAFDTDGIARLVDPNGAYVSKEDADVRLGSAIYLDMAHGTALFPSDSFEQIIEQAELYYKDDRISKRLFYLDIPALYGEVINGEEIDGAHDYTPLMKQYLYYAKLNNNELHGMVEVDETLLEIMKAVAKLYDGFGGVENSWQKMCYYYAELGND